MKAACKNVFIFGGTTEGRWVAERLLAAGVPCTVSVATPYGREVLTPHPLMTVHTGRLDRRQMEEMLRAGHFSCVVDATHPHARIVSGEIAAACAKAALPCLRLERGDIHPIAGEEEMGKRAAIKAGDIYPIAGEEERDTACVYVRDVDEAGAYLASRPGHILSTIGSKGLVRFVEVLGKADRVTARVLPTPESLSACTEAGLVGKQIIAMQGPFDTEMNCAQIHHTGAAWLLTKETGAAGGYPEKLEAAKRCGIRAVVIRPPSADENEDLAGRGAFRVYNLDQTLAEALKYAGRGGTQKRILYLVGVGVGAQETGTCEAHEAIASAQVLFGAQSVLDNLAKTWHLGSTQSLVPCYDSTAILKYLSEHPEIHTAAVAYSGDSGFYSGAASMLGAAVQPLHSVSTAEETDDRGRQDEFDLRVVSGISCVSFFAARVGLPWQHWKILSTHGRFCNVTGHVLRNRECFLLLSGAEDLRETGRLLAEARARGLLGPLRLIYGYALSRPAEEIREVSAQSLCEITREGLYVLYIRHDDADQTALLPGLLDSAFIRGKAPMTSAEIRALSLCKLGLTSKAVVWDVGAGTGSVSIEAARACPDGQVYSVEYKKDALLLLNENRANFCLMNMEVVPGRAPEALSALPAPTHVFIGGSGGEVGEILKVVFLRNPRARVVVNCITAETLTALKTALKSLSVRDVSCTQVIVNREEMLGSYHYLKAGNPVFIFSFSGTGAD